MRVPRSIAAAAAASVVLLCPRAIAAGVAAVPRTIEAAAANGIG